jgi:hypothetical protein
VTGAPDVPGGRSSTFSGSALEQAFREIARQEAQAAVRAAFRDLPGSTPRLTSIAAYAKRCGLGYATLRRWVRAAAVRPGPAGRYLAAELDAVVARGGKPPPTPEPTDLAAERARRAVDSLTRGKR